MKRPLLALAAALTLSCNSPASGLFVVMDVSPFFMNTPTRLSLHRVQLQVFDNGGALRNTVDFEQPVFPMSFSVRPNNLNGTYRLELTGYTNGQPAERLFVVRRLVTMKEGEVRAISIPVRGHCLGSGVTRCTMPNETCLAQQNLCASSTQPTIAWREGLDAPCSMGELRDEAFNCTRLPP